MYIITFISIVGLILTNAVTDAPNAISTLVGTNVMKFKRAARLSAIFNFLGIIVMSLINLSVANCISSIVNMDTNVNGIIGITCAMISVIIFSMISLYFGIPTSETHGLVAGLTGSSIALYGFKNAINWNEWKNVLIGLVWSIVGTYIISIIISKILKKFIHKISINKTKKSQIFATMGMSFMHGAQDGQKFIGVLIMFLAMYNQTTIENVINSETYIWIIVFTAILMFFGVSIGGRKIVEKVGTDMVEMGNAEALLSDISTTVTLFVASMTGLPVSTTHVKTVSIIGIGKSNKTKMDKKVILDIVKAWFWTFPICGVISYILVNIMKM